MPIWDHEVNAFIYDYCSHDDLEKCWFSLNGKLIKLLTENLHLNVCIHTWKSLSFPQCQTWASPFHFHCMWHEKQNNDVRKNQ